MHALNLYSVIGTAIGPEDTTVNKTHESLPTFMELTRIIAPIKEEVNKRSLQTGE